MSKKIYILLCLLFNCFGLVDAQTINFQDTKGELTVDGSGSANYKVPIALPPGIKDVAPQIALVYNSSGSNGVAGYGWNIAGVSSINRIGTRKDLDGIIKPINFDDSDQFALDGQRLIKQSDNSLKTENYSNLKIVVNNGNLTSPDYFIVYSADGSISYYGNVQNSKGVAEWLITKWIDTNGNTIKYDYVSNSNVINLSKITWSENEKKTTNFQNTMEFVYKARVRPESAYLSGNNLINKKILDYIVVKTNGTQFRKYLLSHDTNDLNYQIVAQIQEFNEFNDAANPVTFNYDKTNSAYSGYTSYNSSTSENLKDVKLNGDFDGDGEVDFVTNKQVYLNVLAQNNLWKGINLPTGFSTYNSFAINAIDSNNKFSAKQLLANLTSTIDGFAKLNVYKLNTNNTFSVDYTKQVSFNTNHEVVDCDISYDYQMGDYETKKAVYLNNDFDGDGISDLLMIAPERVRIVGQHERDFDAMGHDACYFGVEKVLEPAKIRILKTNRNASTVLGSSDYVDIDLSQINIPFVDKDEYSFHDFDGDGIKELYVLDYKSATSTIYSIFSIKLKDTAPFYEVKLIKQATYSGDSRGIVFGDFNGDGKEDMFIPQGNKSSNWLLYTSTGMDFITEVYNNFYLYEPSWGGPATINRKKYRKYQGIDINNDGKSDFVISEYESFNESINNRNGRGHVFIKPNLGASVSSNTVVFGSEQQSTINTGYGYEDYIHFIPGNYDNGGRKSNFMFIQGSQVWKGNYLKDHSKDKRLLTVKESNGTLEQTLEYTELLAKNTNIYKSTNSSVYPAFDLQQMPNLFVVSKQIFNAQGKSKYRLFQYRDLNINYNGLGILGFKKVAQSSWIVDGINNTTPVWNVSQMDPTKRGANITSWSFSGTNTTLIDSYSNSNLLSKTTNNYTYTILPDKRFILLPQSITENNFISGVTTATTNTYDSYYNIATTTKTKTANGQTFKTTTTNTVENLPSSNPYIIGRLKKEVSKVDAYGGSYTSQKEYTYTNNNISKTKTTVQNEGIQIIDYTYDTFGNVLTITDNGKQLSGSTTERIAARKIENIYDTNGRFVVKKKDIEGYETNLEYNLLGQVTKETDKFGAVTSTVYDNWGKLLNVTLANSSTTPVVTQYQYARDNNGWSIISFSDQKKGYKAQYFDAVGNNIKNTIKGFSDGQYVSTSTEYDFLGRKLRESQPYFSSPSQYTTYEYDYLLRPTKVTNHTGLVATNTYEGLTTTTVEGARSKKITKDAAGNTAQLIDNGTETINYTYYPHGGVKTTTYGSHVITTNYDVWGRRTSLLDPSVSSTPYAYSYTVYDEMKEEKMPEGTTTYKYDNFGKITEKNTTGKSNISVKYTYDTAKKGLLIKEYGTNENNSFSNDITYDNFYRIANRNEVTPQFVFGKQFVYDEFGRIMNSESYVWKNSLNKRVQTVILNHQYNPYNGELNQLLDISKGVGKVVWKANAKNERGQTLNATLGELISVENTYDIYGNITNIRNKKGNNWLYSVDYEYYFDGQVSRGLLKRRYDSHFGWEEKFTYDNFDRLVSWSSPNVQNYNTYLTDGRIDVNNQVGKYAYNATAKYKKESIQLNAPGSDYYSRRKQQDITYDAFKRPLTISEEGRGNVDFQYGINGGRFYALKQDVLANKTTEKYYSQDGTIEITVDQNGNAKIINYISSPYDTPFFYVTETNLNSSISRSKEGFHYLARDFQGSIMAIYDENANVIERRLFDPWGNIVKVQDVNGNVTEGENAKLIFLDRGYTGHEHFTEVGIIHMNGRIYDPMLKQFLSPDNFIQDPENSQNYNRYGYAWNNPLLYTDPSGEVFQIGFGLAVGIGAAIGALTYTIQAIMSGTFDFRDFAKGIFIGAVSGAVSFGVGEIATALFNGICQVTATLTANQIGYIVGAAQMVMHGVSQGVIQGVSGGANFGQTFISAMISSAVSGAVQGAGNIAGLKDGAFRTILFGTVSGGISAELTGGNFWQGAATGLIVSGLNHAAHELNRYNLLKKLDPYKPTLVEELARAAMPRAAKLTYDAIAITTGQARHMYGPDAVSIGIGVEGGAVMGFEGSTGYIALLRGQDSGMKMYLDGGTGAIIPSISITANITQYFYSGSVKNLSFDTFRGARWSLGVSLDVGASIGVGYSNSIDGFKKYTHAYSSSVGTGLSIMALGLIATYGSTWINP
ncbi:RHS repeat-associated core domain-containing protein [Empedobacter brevis]